VALAEGLYVYNAKAQQLDPVAREDLRAATGGQPFVGQAALDLVYVARQASRARGTIRRPSPKPDSSPKTYTCTAPRRDSRPWCAARSTGRRWRRR